MAPAIARTSNAADRPNPQMHTALRFVQAFPQFANPAALELELASEYAGAQLHALAGDVRGCLIARHVLRTNTNQFCDGNALRIAL
ncbi:hypothetical protein EII19_10695 [Comamonadaceae bacterium OH2310_COT-174]|nr:hypothetical protein EII19_10695 [Comamonadaceae bacterium OH2310_COT-174]